MRDDHRYDAELRVVLDRTYDLKTLADYASGSSAKVVPAQADKAVAAARYFVES